MTRHDLHEYNTHIRHLHSELCAAYAETKDARKQAERRDAGELNHYDFLAALCGKLDILY